MISSKYANGNGTCINLLAVPLPDIAEQNLRTFCLRCEKLLASVCMDNACLKYIDKFKPQGPALAARTARILSRLALYGFMRQKETKPDRAKNYVYAFSYSSRAAFCALGHGTDEHKYRFAIDAECATKTAQADALVYFLKKLCPADAQKQMLDMMTTTAILQLWLLYETALKIHGEAGLDFVPQLLKKLRMPDKNGSIIFKNEIFSWRIMAFWGHWLCLAATIQNLPPVRPTICSTLRLARLK